MKTRLLANLQVAEDALRDNLHVHDMDATARAHMQRALCHLRESCIALDGGHARSVDQLVSEQALSSASWPQHSRLRRNMPKAWPPQPQSESPTPSTNEQRPHSRIAQSG